MKAPGDEFQKMSNFSKTISKLFGPRKKSFSGRPFPKKNFEKNFQTKFSKFFLETSPRKNFFSGCFRIFHKTISENRKRLGKYFSSSDFIFFKTLHGLLYALRGNSGSSNISHRPSIVIAIMILMNCKCNLVCRHCRSGSM